MKLQGENTVMRQKIFHISNELILYKRREKEHGMFMERKQKEENENLPPTFYNDFDKEREFIDQQQD